MKKLAVLFSIFTCVIFSLGTCLADDYDYRERFDHDSATFEGRRRPANPFRVIGEIGGTVIRAPLEVTRGMGDVVSGRKALNETSYKIRHDGSGRNASYRNYPYDPEGRLPQSGGGHGFGPYDSYNPLLNGGFVPGIGYVDGGGYGNGGKWAVGFGSGGLSGFYHSGGKNKDSHKHGYHKDLHRDNFKGHNRHRSKNDSHGKRHSGDDRGRRHGGHGSDDGKRGHR